MLMFRQRTEVEGNAAITDMMRQRDVAALDGIHEAILMLKLKMMLCVMMLPLAVGIKSSLSVSAGLPTASGVDNAASPDWQTPLNGIISPQREADHYAKTTGRNPEVY